MKNQIVRFSPFQTAKIMTVLYFLMGLVFTIPMLLVTMMAGAQEGAVAPNLLLIIAMPFMYAILSFIFVPLACLAYNICARLVGGIEVTMEATDDT